MRIGIMGAMTEEVDSIKQHMTNLVKVEHGSREYYIGSLFGTEIVLTFSRWGKVAAAATVTSLITEFKTNKIIFTGVAGAVSPTLNIGDIIIADKLYQHDMDARPLFAKHKIPLTDLTFFITDQRLVQQTKLVVDKLFKESSMPIDKVVLKKFGINAPKCLIGMIASGDQFIANVAATKQILAEQPKTLAVEMEGAAVAQVCHDYDIPFVVIRTISDRADHAAHIDFSAFINEVSRHYAENIIKYLLS